MAKLSKFEEQEIKNLLQKIENGISFTTDNDEALRLMVLDAEFINPETEKMLSWLLTKDLIHQSIKTGVFIVFNLTGSGKQLLGTMLDEPSHEARFID
ncbi:MAG: hypothetical protein NWR47_01210 [Aestuariivirgaceae bacterium]|nr:hypothetical protein [Aestuariivirgaceae bacterium]